MRVLRLAIALAILTGVMHIFLAAGFGGQFWVKCKITCRCLQNNQIGAFTYMIPIDKSPDPGFEADKACKAYGQRMCSDGCNGSKFSYTYQVTGP